MDEAYLTGEPFTMSKTPGSAVLSGAINGDSALTIRADKLAADSRYAKIMQVMRASGSNGRSMYRQAINSAPGIRRWPLSSPSPRGR